MRAGEPGAERRGNPVLWDRRFLAEMGLHAVERIEDHAELIPAIGADLCWLPRERVSRVGDFHRARPAWVRQTGELHAEAAMDHRQMITKPPYIIVQSLPRQTSRHA